MLASQGARLVKLVLGHGKAGLQRPSQGLLYGRALNWPLEARADTTEERHPEASSASDGLQATSETIHSTTTTFDISEAPEEVSSYPAVADNGDNVFADLSWIDMFCDSFPLEGANELFAALE